MQTTTRRVYWGILVMAFVLVFSTGFSAQSRPVAVSTSPSPVAHDLNTILAELMRATPATSKDLTTLQQHGGRLQWVTFWQGDKAQKAKMTEALRRNLQLAVPDLIHDAQASGGSISTTFKLYNDLTVVCESLESLLSPGLRERKTELSALSSDLSDMNRLREELSSYIQQTAVSMESKNARLLSSAARPPKRVVVDDNSPERPSPRKRSPSNQ